MKKLPALIAALAAITLAACAGTAQPSAANAAPAPQSAAVPLDAALEQIAGELAAKLPPGAVVAVTRFESISAALSEYLLDEFSSALVNQGVTVADRDSLAYIYKEQGFQISGDVSDETMVSIGRMLGAGSVLSGALVNVGSTLRLRVNSLNVETARQELSLRRDVLNDADFHTLLNALDSSATFSKDADYGGR
jgi:hypothetical protein